MREITRREFIKGLTALGLCAFSGRALLACARREKVALPPEAAQERPLWGQAHEASHYIRIQDDLNCQACHRAVEPSRLLFCHTPHTDHYVKCQLCFRECIIAAGDRGFCGARENRGGKLYSLVYGRPCALQTDPIELEPMYHLLPGHRNLALATAGCNFRCRFCHNWHISQRGPDETKNYGFSPEEIVKMAVERGCESISSTMNEPTVFYEYMRDIAKLARERGLRTLFHTNGALRPAPLFELLEFMDAVTVDLKGFTSRFYHELSSSELEPVLETLQNIKKTKVHLEIVNLIIPTFNDDLDDIERMCLWIRENLGEEVPLHFTRFFPAYKMTHLPPTPIETLERAIEIATGVGLHYVYIGNVPGHERNSTFCPKCGQRLIHRIHLSVLSLHIKGGRCQFCGHEIPGIWEPRSNDERDHTA